ncbi:MAG TPA: hypothetical protein VJH34_01610 [archaeon]|nr:hypothetical protein [archaeon]
MIEIGIGKQGIVFNKSGNQNGKTEDNMKMLADKLDKNEMAIKILSERVDVLLTLLKDTVVKKNGNGGIVVDKNSLNQLQ